MSKDGMFDPVRPSAPAARPIPLPQWRVISPIPENAPAPPAAHPKLGSPAMRWEYRDASGCLLGIVDRYHGEDGTKEVRPLAYAEHQKWGRQWRWLGLPRPRPLYGLDRLAVRPAAPVVVVEGEKSADAAASLLPEHVVS